MAGYALREKYESGYRNKEDISTLPPNVLVVGSQNVLTNAAEQVGIRQGYVLDGDAGDESDYGIDSAYDFQSQAGVKNTRKWGAKLQVRYKNPVTLAVSWITLLSSLIPTNRARFTSWWDVTVEKKTLCLFANGDNTIYEWTGAIGSVDSTSAANGIIAAITNQPNTTANTSGGAGYAVGDVLTITGGNVDATLTVLAVAPGGVSAATLASGGTGYSANDLVSFSSGSGRNFLIKVLTVDGSGVILTFVIVRAGAGFFAGGSYTTVSGGGGTLAAVTITTIGNTITDWQLTQNGTGYSTGTRVATTGGSGTGATVEILTVGQYAIKVSGSKTMDQLGFYSATANANKFQVVINGTTIRYTASNANGGMSIVGLDQDPTLLGIAQGDAMIQVIAVTTANGVTSLPTNFNFDLISSIENHVFYGDEDNNTVYFSDSTDYKTVAASSPRLPTQGGSETLDAAPVGFKPQSTQSGSSLMYIAAGDSQWYAIGFQLSADLTKEAVTLQRLKTTALQGAQSQELISDFKNTITFVSHEPQLNEFGVQANYFSEPQMVNISDPIKFDMDAYDFTGGAVDYDNYYLYVLIPENMVVRMYNLAKKYWEAPQVLPISRLYRVDGEVYGHSSETNESYKLFDGYNDNGNPINAIAAFPYVASATKIGEPDDLKTFDRIYTEGYIAGNTELTLQINYDFGGFTGTYEVTISGQAPSPFIFNKVTDGSLGQNTLGSQPIGTILNLGAQPALPKFRIINTMPKHDFYESQIVYSSNDVDQQWTLLRFGPRMQPSVSLPVGITL